MVDTPCSLAWIGAPAARGEPEERPCAAAAENEGQTLKKEPRGRLEVLNTKLDVCGSSWMGTGPRQTAWNATGLDVRPWWGVEKNSPAGQYLGSAVCNCIVDGDKIEGAPGFNSTPNPSNQVANQL